jgi:tRNA threonylcarbamoyladenosine biosynthesis protein TsaE
MESPNPLPLVKCLPSSEASRDLAVNLAYVLKVGDLLLFTGGIGSGKTTFIQGLAKGLDVKERVTSPSFILQAVYESGRIPLSHVDLYRLTTNEEIEDFGFEDYLESTVTAVEWADRYSRFQPPCLRLNFEFGPLEDDRIITVIPDGGDWSERLALICREEGA